MNIVVIGGGISGHLVKLRLPHARVLDWRRSPAGMTRQYGGNYLWEPLPGVACRSFTVRTTVDGQVPTPSAVVEYKRKIGKGLDENWRDQFRYMMTGYDIVEWPRPLRIEYGYVVRQIDLSRRILYALVDNERLPIPYDVLVSTVPLYALVEMVPDMGRLQLLHSPIYVHTTPIPPDAVPPDHEWRVNYISDPAVPAYRTTDRDGIRHYESLTSAGSIPAKRITPGKIFRDATANAMVQVFEDQGVYCFGRFARWNPEELVHETDAAIRAWKERMGL